MTSIDDLELELRKLPGVRAAGFDPRDDLLVIQLHVASARGELNLPVAATRIAAHHSDRPVAVEIIRWREQPPTRPLGPVPVESAVSPEPVEAPDVVEHLEPAEPAEPAEAVEPLAPTEPIEAPDVVEHREPAEPVEALDLAEADVTAEPAEPAEQVDVTEPLEPLSLAEPPELPAREPAPARRPRLLAVLAFPDTDELEVHLILEGRRTIGRAAASGGLVAAVTATIEALRALGVPVSPSPRWVKAIESSEEGGVLVAVALDGNGGAESRYGLARGSSPIDAAARSTLDALNRRLELVF